MSYCCRMNQPKKKRKNIHVPAGASAIEVGGITEGELERVTEQLLRLLAATCGDDAKVAAVDALCELAEAGKATSISNCNFYGTEAPAVHVNGARRTRKAR